MPPKAKPRTEKPPVTLTDDEIDAIAEILNILGELGDWDSRITVMALAYKIGIAELNHPDYKEIREAAGLFDEPLIVRRR